jgi:hypothetical protein
VRRRAALAVVAAVAVGAVGVVPPASAAWTSPASGAATARSATVLAPSSLVATCGVTPGTVTLTWTASSTPWIDGYEIGSGTVPGTYTSNVATSTATTYTSPPLVAGTFVFAVRATKGEWRSAYSNEVVKVVVAPAGTAICQ